MTMVRVEYTIKNSPERRKIRGWDLHMKDGLVVIDQPVQNGDEITIATTTLGSISDFIEFDVQPCDGSINEHLAKCRQWRMTDEELEELLK